MAQTEEGGSTGSTGGDADMPEVAGFGNEAAAATPEADGQVFVDGMVKISCINSFKDVAFDMSGMFHYSEDAKQLLLGELAFSADGLQVLQSKLTNALWQVFYQESKATDCVLLSMKPEDSKNRIQVCRPVDADLRLPFVGPVTQSLAASKDSNGYKLCTIFGIDFFVSPMSCPTMSWLQLGL